MPLTEETKKILCEKYPEARPVEEDTLFPGDYNLSHAVAFEHITGDIIWRHALYLLYMEQRALRG